MIDEIDDNEFIDNSSLKFSFDYEIPSLKLPSSIKESFQERREEIRTQLKDRSLTPSEKLDLRNELKVINSTLLTLPS